jgi:transcriptional regulator with XRE-family HTH domain
MARPNEPQTALGNALRQLREKRGLTQEAVAHEAGITTGSLSLIEGGQRNPSWGTVNRIAIALGSSMGEIGKLADKFKN